MTAEIQMPQQHIAIISHSGLHEPWREIVHMGTHLVFPRSHYNHQATTDCFYFIDKGRVRLTYTNAAGEDHVVMFFGDQVRFCISDSLNPACCKISSR